MAELILGIAGLGHVGCGLIHLVEQQANLRLPGQLKIAGVSARNRHANRVADVSGLTWFDDPVALAVSPEIDVFVELMGGADGKAREAVEAALNAGKPVVTANKALIAEHGPTLSALAEAHSVDLLFEAAVAGGVPIVRALRDSLSGIQVQRVSGILNGTCNFLTTEMLARCSSYQDVLEEAQALGYAEADPTLDVSGMDAAHKMAILSAIAFSAELDFPKVEVHGIDQLDLIDLSLADRMGYTIKLIAEGILTERGVVCRVEPKALSHSHPLTRINGALNTVQVEGEPLGAVMMTGPGAGAGPTASAVMGDISKLFRPGVRSPFGGAPHHIRRQFVAPFEDERSPWFLRAHLADESGAMAALSDVLATEAVSIDQMLQDSAGSDGSAPVALVTHVCSSADIKRAVARLEAQDTIIGFPRFIRIEIG